MFEDDFTIDESGATGDSGIVGGFFQAARDRISGVLAPMRTSAPTSESIGGQVFDAIYAFGRGKTEAARDKLVGAFLRTGEGQRVQASASKQTIAQYLPLIVLAAVALLALGFFVRR